MVQYSKAQLHTRLKRKGYILRSSHWKHLDGLFKTGNGFIMDIAILEAAKSWGWTPEMVRGLKAVLDKS